MTETFQEFCQSLLIVMTTYNRKAVTEVCLKNMEAVKGEAALWVVDDHSTEYGLKDLERLAPTAMVRQYDKKLGVEKLRAQIQGDALKTLFKYIYHTDNDAYHDPDWLHRLFELHQKHTKLIGLFNSRHHFDKTIRFSDQLSKMAGFKKDDVRFRRACPGISFFFDMSLIKEVPAVGKGQCWDFAFGEKLLPAVISTTSYVEHFGADGLHNKTFDHDRSQNPTKWLQKQRTILIDQLKLNDK